MSSIASVSGAATVSGAAAPAASAAPTSSPGASHVGDATPGRIGNLDSAYQAADQQIAATADRLGEDPMFRMIMAMLVLGAMSGEKEDDEQTSGMAMLALGFMMGQSGEPGVAGAGQSGSAYAAAPEGGASITPAPAATGSTLDVMA